MAEIVPPTTTIEYRFSDSTASTWNSTTSIWRSSLANIGDLIDMRIQETVSDMKSTLSAMACTGCGGNIDPQTLLCSCCGRQYRLVASNDEVVDNARYGATEVF